MTPESIPPVAQALVAPPEAPAPAPESVPQAPSIPEVQAPTSPEVAVQGAPNPSYTPGTESPGTNQGVDSKPWSQEAQTPATGTTSSGDPGLPKQATPEAAITPATVTTSSGNPAVVQPEVLSGGVEDPAAHHGFIGKLALKLKLTS